MYLHYAHGGSSEQAFYHACAIARAWEWRARPQPRVMASSFIPDAEQPFQQRVIVIRHGERLDNVDYTWTDTATRPYDPPLTERGVEQARETGKRFMTKVTV